MVLRSLSMFGFKSFAEKLEIEFGEGITAIIGPNGCGKSNVVDAIRWVFGEQKASALRSSNMQDVIFSGSQKRQPLGMAEVTLTIENSKRILPIEYTTVAITRRIFRTGDTEYLINRVPCRLRDIHNLFIDTGIGTSAYTTIENNMINQILSDKAEERRILFDEAAGIGKYKQRRTESQRQLERTRQDLLRINDQVTEVDRQVKMLARHVEKARRWKLYHDDLKKLEVGFENGRYGAFSRSVAERKRALDEIESGREVLRAKIAAAESAIEQRCLEAMGKENDVQAAARTVAEAGEKINDLDREISVSIERRRSLEEKVARLGAEIEAMADQVEQNTALKSQIERSVIDRESKRDLCAARVAGAVGELAAFDARFEAARESAERLGEEQIGCINSISDCRNLLSNLEANLTNCIEQAERYDRDIAALESRHEEYRDAADKSRAQLATAAGANERYLQSRETLVGRIEREEERYQGLVEREKRTEAQIDTCKTQLKFLAGLDANFEGYEAGVKTLLTEKLPGMLGIVADCITVTDQSVMPLIERACATAVQTVVFESDDAMKAAMAFIDRADGGSARMVSLERLAKSAANHDRSAPVGTALNAFIVTRPGCEAIGPALFGSMVLVETIDEALEHSLAATSGAFVSRDGRIAFADATVAAGSTRREDAGLLQRKAQIKQLGEDIQKLAREYETIVRERESCIITRDEAKYALVEVDEKINRGRQEQQEQETAIRHYEKEIENISERLEETRIEAQGVAVRQKELELQHADGESELARRQAVLMDLQQKVEQAKQALAAMDEERRQLAEHLKNVELEMHGLANTINQNKQDIERLAKAITEAAARKNALTEEQRSAAASMDGLKVALAELHVQLERQKTARTELEAVSAAVREEYNGLQATIEDMRKGLRVDQADIEQVANQSHELELAQTKDEDERRRIRERMWEMYEVDLESPEGELPVIEQDEASVIENISVLKERIKRLGTDVNTGAIEDYETESKRLVELTTQRDDLQKAVEDLEKAIKKLDQEARAQFIATFELVQKKFFEMFTTLFEGGEAHLALQEGVDPLEAKIEINVRPTGKKMRPVQMLSGGERALTAIALLFGLYMVKPSAYCILDELDAPLDDANVYRFLNALRQFSKLTQFIVITHNQQTMEAADLLYGVTQQEKGVSTIVSVKFEDIQYQQAA